MNRSLPFLALTLCASAALASPPVAPSTRLAAAVSTLVKQRLLQTLERVEAKRNSFSRIARPPVARRVRVIDEVARTDARGRRFLRFAVDERRASKKTGDWRRDAIVGCAYPEQRQVFVREGDVFLPARSAWGKGGDEAPEHVCRSAGEGKQIAVHGV